MGRALTALLLLLAAAPAEAGVLVVWAPDVPLEQRAKVAARLADAGIEVTRAEEAAHLLSRVRLVSVVDRALDDDCGGAVAVEAWRRELVAAEARLLQLDLRGALSGLSLLELQAACLRTPVTAVDLFTLELDLATVHQLLARQGAVTPEARAFSERERDAALRRAAAVGVGLAPPASLNVELRARLAGIRAARREEPPAGLWLVGPGAGFGARINGRPAEEGGVGLPSGPTLLQVAPAGEVEAAALVELEPGSRTVAWLDPAGPGWGAAEVQAALGELGPEPPPAEVATLLAALGAAAASGPDGGTEQGTVWVGWERGDAWAWRAAGEGLEAVGLRVRGGGPRVEEPAPVAEAGSAPDGARRLVGPPWAGGSPAGGTPVDGAPKVRPTGEGSGAPGLVVAVGAGPQGGWTDLRGGPLDGLGGALLGGGAWARAGQGRWLGTLSLGLAGTPSRRPLDEGGGLLFRATMPMGAGLRWAPRGLDGGELGVDLGGQWFGPYEGRQRGSPTVGLAGGWAGPAGPGLGWRAGAGLTLGHTPADRGGGWYWTPCVRVGLEVRP